MPKLMRPIRVPGLSARVVFNGPRSDAPSIADIGEVVEGIDEGFKAFKDKHEAEQSEQKTALAALEAQMREFNTHAAAGRALGVGLGVGYGNDALSPAARADRESFVNFFRRGQISAAMSTDSNPDGGYLVPTEVEKGIGRIAVDLSPMRRLARVVTTSTGVFKKIVSLNSAVGAWTTEKAARNQTQGLTLSELAFPIHELTAMPAISQTLS